MASPKYKSTAEFLDAEILRPRNSVLTGEMLMYVEEWYGIKVLPQLVILGAETSLGKPPTPEDIGGGQLVLENNFGCMRYFESDLKTKWGALSDGKIEIRGKLWYTFPTPIVGLMAWGRYMKLGPKNNTGFYKSVLDADQIDWAKFAAVYYGKGEAGYAEYVSRCYGMETNFRQKALVAGFHW